MADLTQNGSLRFWNGNRNIEQITADTTAAFAGFKGAPLVIDQNVDTLNVIVAASGVTLVDDDVFVGICAAKYAYALGDTESDAKVEYYGDGSIVGFNQTQFGSSFTNADMGKTIYMSDSGTLTSTRGSNCPIGKLHRVEDGYAYVQIVAPAVIDVA